MLYRDFDVQVPADQQDAFNEKAYQAARQGDDATLSKEDCYNAWTGEGGLSGLSRADYGSYEAYARDKRAREAGQFMTPGWIGRLVVALSGAHSGETICDPACGHGALFNAAWTDEDDAAREAGQRFYGCEIDERAATIARHLFPGAEVHQGTLSHYAPPVAPDVVLANPPFALKIAVGDQALRSEEALLLKASEFLRPGGIACVVLPSSLFRDGFHEKSRIRRIERRYRPLCRLSLGEDAFAPAGVTGLRASVLALQRRGRALSEEIDTEPRAVTEVPERAVATPRAGAETEKAVEIAEAFGAEHVGPAREAATACRAALRLEEERGRTAGEREAKARTGFYDRARKLIFDIGRSEASARQPEARALLSRFEAQGEPGQRPSHLSAEEWSERRLSKSEVIERLEAIRSEQHAARAAPAKRERLQAKGLLPGPQAPARKQIGLVKTGAELRLKGYTAEAKARIEQRAEAGDRDVVWSIPRLATGEEPLPKAVRDSRYARLVERKRRLRRRHEGDLMDARPAPALVAWLRSRVVEHPDEEAVARGDVEPRFSPTQLQAEDMARALTRRYVLLNWAMGTGKTAASFCIQQVHLGRWAPPSFAGEDERALLAGAGTATCGFVVAPALAVSETWRPFLSAQGVPYRLLATRPDVEAAQEAARERGPEALAGERLVVKQSKLHRLKAPLRRLQRMLSFRTSVVIDESDNYSNPKALRTKAMLSVFRRSKMTVLLTGTPTRNHVAELYPQLEALYNNSALFEATAPALYKESKALPSGELASQGNPFRGQPYPAYYGERVFSASFAPRTKSVFGILTQDQDLYNSAALEKLLARTRITRTFAEVAGEDQYQICHEPVAFSEAEEALHQRLLDDFARVLHEGSYFERTGNARKEAGLRAVRQLRLLIASAQHPHLFEHYEGPAGTRSRKMQKVRAMTESFAGERVAIGLRRKEVFGRDYLKHWAGYLSGLGRPIFVVRGEQSPSERGETTGRFQESEGGILVTTQQSLPSSINVPRCNRVILPELTFNLSSASQHFMRYIRFDMPEETQVHLVTYRRSIEANLLNLVLAKEQLNVFVRDGQLAEIGDLMERLQIEQGTLKEVLAKRLDTAGRVQVDWEQTVHS